MKSSKNKKLPKIIKNVGFNFHWDNKKVWALDVPVEEMDISEFEWHFAVPFWDKPNEGYYDLTPNEVIKNPKKFNEEYERTMKSDLSHPLDIMLWKGKWLMLDGLHRLVKQKIQGVKKIKVRKIPREYITLIRT